MKSNRVAFASSANWPHADIYQLLDKIKAYGVPNDCVSFKIRESKIDWSSVAFGHYTPEECQNKWKEILHNVRCHRTIEEICNDASEFVRTGKGSRPNKSSKQPRDPNKPKRPLTPFLSFLMDYRDKNKHKLEKLPVNEVSKIASEEFKKLSEKKKAKLQDKYQSEMAEYRLLMQEYKASQAAVSQPDTQVFGEKAPEPPKGPIHFYLKKLIKKGVVDSSTPKSEQLEIAKTQYAQLKDGKKIKFIRKAAADEFRYTKELQEFKQNHPDSQVKESYRKLSKADRELKALYDGKPAKPPRTGYHLFLQQQLEDVVGDRISKMGEARQEWKSMTKAEQESFNSKAAELQKEYNQSLEQYLSSLSPEEREAELSNGLSAKRKQYEKLGEFIHSKQARTSFSDSEG